MYLAKNVGDGAQSESADSITVRHYTTVLHAIPKIELLRQTDESLDALIEVITAQLSLGKEGGFTERFQPGWTTALMDAVADRVLEGIRRLPTEGNWKDLQSSGWRILSSRVQCHLRA